MKKGKLLLALAIVLLICISLYALTLLLNREPAAARNKPTQR